MGGFTLIGNLIEVRLPSPVSLTPSHRIERPTDEQLTGIGTHLAGLGGAGAFGRRGYESVLQVTQSAQGSSSQFVPVPREQWRYHVVTHERVSQENRDIVTALEIGSPSIWCAYYRQTDQAFGRGVLDGGWDDPIAAHTHYQSFSFMVPPVVVDQAFVERAERTFTNLRRLDKEQFPEIERALSTVVELRRFVHFFSPIRVLSLFAILEMLLTHQPRLETDDSITHQLTTKIDFLSPRLIEPLDYTALGTAPAQKIWKALYAYRSALAHGRQVNFKTAPDLRILGDERRAREFLDDSVRRLIRHALSDPVVFRDIRPI
jgi:hypothetical protein